MSVYSFEEGGDDPASSKCDGKYYPENSPEVAPSTGWFEHLTPEQMLEE